ncbi:protocadherin-8-like [Ambystoma mexicanum]|uniref:protocadherin-8-like n=1 Tax=Ambystoma mexicanum TaxID=8296 RepID=UPI0037E82465
MKENIFDKRQTTFRFMDHLYADILFHFVIIYLDDILVYSNSPEDHIHMLIQSWNGFNQINSTVNPPNGISMDPKKVSAVLDWPSPASVKDVQRFLGFSNFYRKFIPCFSEIILPITRLLKKGNTFSWNDSAQKAFQTLKEKFTSASILITPDQSKQLIVETDASQYALGAVRLQTTEQGEERPVAYLSKTFNTAEQNYSVLEKELLAIKQAFKEWRHLLLGSTHPIKVRTDHQNLRVLQNAYTTNSRQARWAYFFLPFRIEFTFLPGKHNQRADALSRKDSPTSKFCSEKMFPNAQFIAVITDFLQKVRIATAQNQSLCESIASSHQLTKVTGYFFHGTQVLIPTPSLQLEVLQMGHDSRAAGHRGVLSTLELIQRNFWWPNLKSDVRDYVAACSICAHAKTPQTPPLGLLTRMPIPDRPWQIISTDFVSDLPLSENKTTIMSFSAVALLSPLSLRVQTSPVYQSFSSRFERSLSGFHLLPEACDEILWIGPENGVGRALDPGRAMVARILRVQQFTGGFTGPKLMGIKQESMAGVFERGSTVGEGKNELIRTPSCRIMGPGVVSPGGASLPSLLLILSMGACISRADTSRYFTSEEEPPGTVIAVLSEDLLFNSADRPASSFRLMKQFNSSLIRMRESDGQLSTGERIDREQLCGQTPHCTLALDVVSFAKDQFRLLHVEVEVRDINDNAPRFPRPQIPLEVSESAAVGTRLPLDIAIDEDVGTNSIQSYQVSVNSHFSLEVQSRADGVKYADLVLVKELDRETQDTVTLELVARDGGSPALSGSAVVTVRVLDFNDHRPVFEHPLLTVELLEDAPAGSLLLDLTAADPDEGVNGQVVYSFGPQVSAEVRELFKLDPRSGRLTLEGQVDFEKKQTYEFDVQAQDLGPSPLSATCKIMVHITDVNDNAPSITITPMTSITAGVAHITEAASRESFVALISTLDSDSGPNGQVHCSLFGHEHFKLQQAYEDSYMIVTTSALDRERISEYNLTIVAEDLGSPPFKTVRHFTIRVSDENDNPPFFSKPVYEVSVLENNAPGSYITTVVARDPDLGNNGRVTYTLVDTEVMGAPLFTFIAVDPGSGALYTVRSFDFETLKELEVTIEASDSGLPQLSSRAVIRIRIVDQNDNPPMITAPRLRNDSADLLMPLGAPANSLVVQLEATDEDEGVNSELLFTILEDRDSIFAINKATGELYLRQSLDSERGADTLSVVVAVSDQGPVPLSATATVNIILMGTAPSSVQLVVIESAEQEWQELDTFTLLAGGFGLLLIAIIAMAAASICKQPKSNERMSSKARKLLEEHTRSEADSGKEAERQSDFCSISTESEVCSDSPCSRERRESASISTGTQGSASGAELKGFSHFSFDPVSLWCEGQSALTLRGHPDQCSVKDSGRGNRDFNDSDSDVKAEGLREPPEETAKQQPGVFVNAERRVYSSAGSLFRNLPQQPPQLQRFPSPYEDGHMIAYSGAPVYQQSRPQLQKPTYHVRDSYQVQIAKSVRLHSAYERVSVGPTPLGPAATLPRRCQEFQPPGRTLANAVNIGSAVVATPLRLG